jgi:hypothetical protein
MANVPDDYERVLAQAAESAVELVKLRESRRANLFEEIRRIDTEITALNAVISASGLRNESPAAVLSELGASSLQVRIRALLKTGPMNAQQLLQTLEQVGNKVSMSTLYVYLAKAKEDGVLVSDKGVWDLSPTQRGTEGREVMGALAAVFDGLPSLAALPKPPPVGGMPLPPASPLKRRSLHPIPKSSK